MATDRHQRLVVEELLTKPSAVSPTLFVGLGGCGCAMVRRVAEHLRRRPDYDERYKDLVKVALVDTNVNDLETHREIADETFLISDFEKEEYADLASGKQFLEADDYFTQWVPRNYRFRAGDTAGAGQIRIESRLGVYYQMKHKDFVQKFRRLLEELKRHEHGHRRLDSPEIRIVVCYSVAGGTGSGAHLPISYMLRDQASELGKPAIIGVAVLPAVFEDKTGVNKDGTFANGYAALKETEALMKLGAPDSRFFPEDGIEFHYDPSQSARRRVRTRPFEFLYVVDKPESFTVEDPVQAAADGLYLQFFSPLYGRQASDYDNYTQHQRFLVPHDFEAKGIPGFTSFYGSYGAAVLLVPVDGLVDYCSQAASLALMRASFLRSIPGDPVYTTLRANREPFHEVTLGEEKNEKPIREADFRKKEPDQRRTLIDRLYMKRVRLLAECELTEGESKRYLALFRHGQMPGDIPTRNGGVEHRKELAKTEEKRVTENGMAYSIASMVLPAITGSRPGEPAGLLVAARRAIDEHAQSSRSTISGRVMIGELKVRASGWVDDFKRVGRRILRDGYSVGTARYPGLDALVGLDFLREDAAEVDLAAKRYAVLSILDRVDWEIRPPEPPGDDALEDLEDGKKVDQKSAPEVVDALEEWAIQRAMALVTRDFTDALVDLKDNLQKFVAVQRVLEQGFDDLERERVKRLETLREKGDSSANQYELDAEALQIEDGRRLWDFFYEDRIADLPELSLADRQVQRLLSDSVTDLSVRGRGASTTATLDKLFTDLRQHAQQFLAGYVGGDPHSPDRERREGLTLSDALELEVVYRALYRSNVERVDTEGHKAIRDLVAEYRHLPPDEQINLQETRHKDYLRDKIKRVVKEKASLLCVYGESKDQHGGVRPDQIFLAAIDENFKNGTIAQAIRSADSSLDWVTSGWHNPKEIIFYRAVLNVPLYVFGRMDEMRAEYHRFRNLARRPKVLHIDQNWETGLPDLDPNSSQEAHRQNLLRNHVINFATLLTTGPNDSADHGLIVRDQSAYCLLDPSAADGDGKDPWSRHQVSLGHNLADAIERLPEVLEAEKVKYLSYQQMLRAVRDGLAPGVLARITRLPFQWRRNRDELQTEYGSNPSDDQAARLKDYTDAYSRLQEALAKLLSTLRNRRVEQKTLGEAPGINAADLDPQAAREALDQSLEILETFCETWNAMEHPDGSAHVSKGFRDLFRPLPPKELDDTLTRLSDLQTGD